MLVGKLQSLHLRKRKKKKEKKWAGGGVSGKRDGGGGGGGDDGGGGGGGKLGRSFLFIGQTPVVPFYSWANSSHQILIRKIDV